VSEPSSNGSDWPVSEGELHAYVDGQLPSGRLAAVQRHLQEQPDDAERVGVYGAQRGALRAAFAGIVAETLPPKLNPQFLLEQRMSERRAFWQMAASVAFALGVGGAGGWLLHGLLRPPTNDLTLLAQEAVANHIVYTADKRRPIELGAEQRDDLARWVSNRLNRQVVPPDLIDSGFRYIGGRLAATPQGPAGLFMYQNDQAVRLTVFVLPIAGAGSHQPQWVDVGRVDGYAWIDKGIGYSVVAAVPRTELRRVADQVRDQFAASA
jgi:anti-sigma factor RsiW